MGIGRPWKAVLLLAVGAAGGGAALAVASVPDSTGVIHACYTVGSPGSTVPVPTTGNVRIIDPSAGQSCSTASPAGVPGERSISWNTVGIQGPPGNPGNPGTPGAPGRSVTIAGGNTFTISGGQVITVGQNPGVTLNPPAFGGHVVATLTLSGGVDLTTDVLSYSLGTHQSGGGAGVGKVKVNEFTITRTSDKASAKLLLACANGSHIKKAVLTLRKAGGVYLTYTLKDSLISAFQGGSNSHGDLKPVETISLNYTKLEVKYTSQKK